MAERSAWRSAWSPFRVQLIDRTAAHFVRRRHETTSGTSQSRSAASANELLQVTEMVAEVFLAMDAAAGDLFGPEKGGL